MCVSHGLFGSGQKAANIFFHTKCIRDFVDDVVVSTNLLRDSE